MEELCQVTQALYQTPTDCGQMLNQFGLSDKNKSLVNELSGGQKQRLFIVLALLPNPEVVFLDELTTGLDTRAQGCMEMPFRFKKTRHDDFSDFSFYGRGGSSL